MSAASGRQGQKRGHKDRRKALALQGACYKTWFGKRLSVPGTLWESGQNATPLLSWAEQDVGGGQESGWRDACGLHVELLRADPRSLAATHTATYPPSFQEALGPGSVPCVSWTVNQEDISRGKGCSALVVSIGERRRALPKPSLGRSGTERDMRHGEQLILLSPQKS